MIGEKIKTVSFFRSAGKFFCGTLISRFSGWARDMLMAFAFGTSGSVAAFFVAFRLAHLLRRLLGEGAMQNALVPKFEQLRTQSIDRALGFFFTLSIVVSLLISALIGVGFASLFVSKTSSDIFRLTVLMLPSLLFICLYGLNSSLHQCEGRFFVSSVAPVAFNSIWCVGVLVIHFYALEDPMFWLAMTINVAAAAQWLVTFPKVFSLLKSVVLRFDWKEIRLFIQPMTLGIIGVGAVQINTAIDAAFARFAAPDGPALLWYAIRIQQAPIALFGIALTSALLPDFSRNIQRNNMYLVLHQMKRAALFLLLVLTPIWAVYTFYGEELVHFLYGRGGFTSISQRGTFLALRAYASALIPMAGILLLAPFFYSSQRFSMPVICSVLSVGLNIVLNGIFVLYMRYGPESVAWATALSAWLNAALLFGAVLFEVKPRFSQSLKQN